jgi:hypothetical protein
VVVSRAETEPRIVLRPISESARAWLPLRHGRDHARVTIRIASDRVAVHRADTTECGR